MRVLDHLVVLPYAFPLRSRAPNGQDAVDLSFAGLSGREPLHDEKCRSLAQNRAVPVHVEGATSPFGEFIAPQYSCCTELVEDAGVQWRLGTSSDHGVQPSQQQLIGRQANSRG